MWSLSESQIFGKCQRRWFFKKHVAHATAKDPGRQRAYRLSKLQSVSAWRGNLVDNVLSEILIPSLKRREIALPSLLQHARTLFERQLTYAKKHSVLSPDVRPSKAGPDFAAFHSVEYGSGPTQEEISRAWNDVEQSLTNCLAMPEILTLLKSAERIITQRPLSFSHSGTTVRAVPDAIVILHGLPPVIVDWKVHSFGLDEASRQLGLYALALSRVKPHSDFPASIVEVLPQEMRLIEVQLLRKSVREYALSEDDLVDVEAFIAMSVTEMELALGEKGEPRSPFDLPPANSGETCMNCQYRRLCWEEN